MFLRSFEDCPTIQLFSAREVTEQLKSIQEIISDVNKDWNKRVDAVSITSFKNLNGMHRFHFNIKTKLLIGQSLVHSKI